MLYPIDKAPAAEWREWADASISWSSRRRLQDAHERRITAWFLAPAVLGLILLIYFCTLSFPVEQWYVGLLSVVLIVPYLTRRFS
jgi:uncharacterized membrane protein